MANNASYALGPIASGVRMNAVVVTPGTIEYDPPLTKLYIGTTGSIELVMVQSGTVTLSSVPVGVLDDIAVLSVPSASASGIIGFW